MDPAHLYQRMLELPDGLLYAALFAAALLENIFPPLPGDLAVVFGGWLAGQGRLALPATYVLVTLGSWSGFMTYYLLGRWLGRSGVHAWLGRWISPETLERSEAWLRWRGPWIVLANRLLAGARSTISLVAGFVGLSPPLVGALSLASCAAWSVLLVGAGYWMGEEWERAVALLSAYNRTVLALLALLVCAAALRWWLRARRRAQGR